jgi:hypothetical protein
VRSSVDGMNVSNFTYDSVVHDLGHKGACSLIATGLINESLQFLGKGWVRLEPLVEYFGYFARSRLAIWLLLQPLEHLGALLVAREFYAHSVINVLKALPGRLPRLLGQAFCNPLCNQCCRRNRNGIHNLYSFDSLLIFIVETHSEMQL